MEENDVQIAHNHSYLDELPSNEEMLEATGMGATAPGEGGRPEVQQDTSNMPQIDMKYISDSAQNLQEQAPGAIEQFQTSAGAWLKGKTYEEEAAWRQEKQAEAAEASRRFEEETRGDPAREAITAGVGGIATGIESIGSFSELVGDSLKTSVNTVFGKPIDQTQNPFSQDYIHGDAGWLDIPDQYVPENYTGLGRLARGFAEFGFLMATTRGVGGGAMKLANTGTVGKAAIQVSRASGVGIAGSKPIQFLKVGSRVAAEGAAAELISSSSEEANLLNLVDESTPWMSPWVKNVIGVNALKVNPDDNPWLARIKTVTAGAGINLVGHTIGAYAKGAWAARQAKKNGMSTELANEFGNKVYQDSWLRSNQLDEAASTEMAADRFAEGHGISHANSRDEFLRKYLTAPEYTQRVNPETGTDLARSLDEIAETRAKEVGDGFNWDEGRSLKDIAENRQADPFVNPRKFNDSERATYRPDSDSPVKQNLREASISRKNGGEGRSYSPLFTEAGLRRMARGDANLAEYINEVAEDLSEAAFKDLDTTLSQADVKALIIEQASELHSIIEDGGEQATKLLKQYFKKDSPDAIIWRHAGNEVVTGTATQKGALQLVINTLAKQAEAISTGALHIADDVPINRQVEQVFDAMKVALIEQKKVSFMTGSELARQKGNLLSPDVKRKINRRLSEINAEEDEYFEALHNLNKQGRHAMMRDLMELHALSNGDIRTLDHIHTWLQAKIRGGDMGGGAIKGRLRQELQGVFYNSILSSLKTPIKAVVSTSMIATSRAPWQFVGASLTGNRKEMAIAWAGIDAMVKAWDESMDMAKYNWDLGVKRKNQSYQGRFDMEGNLAEWQALTPYFQKYGTTGDKKAFNFINTLVEANSSPFMKYSAISMGSGDAWARTMIGRSRMRMMAARDAIEKQGTNLGDVLDLSRKTEENFRNQVFKKNKDGKWIVHDKAARLAGDEATMTKALEGWATVFETIQRVPGMRGFFPFARTGVNALDLTFQHTPLALRHKKWLDLQNGINLDKYGLEGSEVAGELAMMRGRMAVGTGAMTLAAVATWKGLMTGDYPYDKRGRDLWRAAGIPPYSFKVGNAWVSYRDMEPFNTVFSVASNLAQNMDILGEDITDQWFQKAAFMTSAILVDKSMLSGIKDLAKVAVGSEGERAALRVVGRYARNRLPWAGLSAQLGTIADANQKEANTFNEMLRQRDLLWKSTIPAKYDMLAVKRDGRPLNYAAENPILRLFNSLSPVAVLPVNNDPIRQGLVDIRYNLPELMHKSPDGAVLNSLQRSELQRYMSMGNLRYDLESIMLDPEWHKQVKLYTDGGLRESKGDPLRNFEFYNLVDQAFQRAKSEAWAQVLENNPELQDVEADLRGRAALAGQGTQGLQELINLPYK